MFMKKKYSYLLSTALFAACSHTALAAQSVEVVDGVVDIRLLSYFLDGGAQDKAAHARAAQSGLRCRRRRDFSPDFGGSACISRVFAVSGTCHWHGRGVTSPHIQVRTRFQK